MTAENARDGEDTQADRRGIRLDKLHTRLDVHDSEVFLVVLLAVILLVLRILSHLMDRIDLGLGFLEHELSLSRRLASQDGTRDTADHATDDHDLGRVLAESESDFVKCGLYHIRIH